MEKSQVIKMRDALKAGKNIPLIVYIDNLFRKIDESNVLQFTKWDDENAILYHYALPDPGLEHSPSNIGSAISLFATDYEMIQAMEAPAINFKDLGDSIDSLKCIAPEWKERIIERFRLALNPDMNGLTHENINKVMGVIDGHKALNDNDDYYAGRYTQPFKETRMMAERNAYAEKVAAEKKNNAADNKQ